MAPTDSHGNKNCSNMKNCYNCDNSSNCPGPVPQPSSSDKPR